MFLLGRERKRPPANGDLFPDKEDDISITHAGVSMHPSGAPFVAEEPRWNSRTRPGLGEYRPWINCRKCSDNLDRLCERYGLSVQEVLYGNNDLLLKNRRPSPPPARFPSPATVAKWQKQLTWKESAYLYEERGLTFDTVQEHWIGWNGERYTVPVYEEVEPDCPFEPRLVNLLRYKRHPLTDDDEPCCLGEEVSGAEEKIAR
jgi:hypothetical protein